MIKGKVGNKEKQSMKKEQIITLEKYSEKVKDKEVFILKEMFHWW